MDQKEGRHLVLRDSVRRSVIQKQEAKEEYLRILFMPLFAQWPRPRTRSSACQANRSDSEIKGEGCFLAYGRSRAARSRRVARVRSKSSIISSLSEDLGSNFAHREIRHFQKPSSNVPRNPSYFRWVKKSSENLDFMEDLLQTRATRSDRARKTRRGLRLVVIVAILGSLLTACHRNTEALPVLDSDSGVPMRACTSSRWVPGDRTS